MLPATATCGSKRRRHAFDEIAVGQGAADEKRKDEAEQREQAAVASQAEIVQ